MARLYPTQKWVTRLLTLPGLGIVKRCQTGSLLVNDQQADWLIAEGYATGETDVDEAEPLKRQPEKTQSEPAAPPPAPPVVVTEPEAPATPPITPELAETVEEDDWQSKAVSFLNTTPVENISETLKGFGPQTVEKLQAAKPLTFEVIAGLLTNAQIKVLQAHFQPLSPA